MEIRKLIKSNFGVDLPIEGGIGDSIENPVIIEATFSNYVWAEHAYVKYFCLQKNIKWQSLGQKLISHNGKKIDVIEIVTFITIETEETTKNESFYFDITEFFERL